MPLYVDSSVVVAVALEEPDFERLRAHLREASAPLSSNLLEAEVRAALRREELPDDPTALLRGIEWVAPPGSLSRHFERILGRAYLRGADLWHLACALDLEEKLGAMRFFSCDRRQLDAARAVGLDTIDGASGVGP